MDMIEVLRNIDIILYGKPQKKRSKYYINTVKKIVDKYGIGYINLVEKAKALGIDRIGTIYRFGDKILEGEYVEDKS